MIANSMRQVYAFAAKRIHPIANRRATNPLGRAACPLFFFVDRKSEKDCSLGVLSKTTSGRLIGFDGTSGSLSPVFESELFAVVSTKLISHACAEG